MNTFFQWPLYIFFLLSQPIYGSQHDFLKAVRILVAMDPSLKKVQAQLIASDVLSEVDRRAWQPQLQLLLGQNSILDDSEGTQRSMAELQVEGEINVWAFGKDLVRRKRADLRQEVNQFRIERLYRESEQRASRILLELINSQKELKLAQKTLNLRKSLMDLADKRYEAGRLSKLERDKVELDYRASLVSFEAIQRGYESQVIRLESYVARDQLPQNWPLDAILVKDSSALLIGWQNLLVREESDVLREARLTKEERELDIELARKDLLPSLDFRVLHTRSIEGSEYKIQRNEVGFYLTIPIFHDFEKSSQVSAAIAASQVARWDYESERVKLSGDEKALQMTLVGLVQSWKQSQDIVELSRDLYQRNRVRFEQAFTNLLELSQDESRMYQAEMQALSISRDLHSKLLELCDLKQLSLLKCHVFTDG